MRLLIVGMFFKIAFIVNSVRAVSPPFRGTRGHQGKPVEAKSFLLQYVPGAYFEAAIAITPGKNKSFVQVITLGVNGAYMISH